MLFTHIFRSTRDLLERCFHQQTLRFLSTVCAHAVQHLLLSCSSARFRTNFRGNALQKLVDPRAFVPRFIHSSEDEFRNIFEIFASTQRTDLSLDRANKFLPFRRGSKTIDSKIDLIRAEREKKKTSI